MQKLRMRWLPMENKNEAEERVIGGLILLEDGNSPIAYKVLNTLKPANFQNEFARLVYKAICDLNSKGKGFDPFIVDSRLEGIEEYSLYGGMARLASMTEETVLNNNLVEYANIVKEQSIERYAERKLFEAIQIIKDRDSGTLSQRLGMFESLVSSIQENTLDSTEDGLKHIKHVARDWLELTEKRQKGEITGHTIGIPSLDEVIAPAYIPNGSLIVVGARPKMGKTSFLARMADHFAQQDKTVAMFNLEMPNISAYERMMATTTSSGIGDFYKIWEKDPDGEKIISNVSVGTQRLAGKKVFMCDKPGITLGFLQRECRNLYRKEGLNLICVDYLTLMEGEKAERNDLAYGKITKGLKNLAKELNCVVLLLTQLNRQLENRPDKRPYPSDSRDTGQIEQDCDMWIGLYREGVYNENCDDPALTEAIVRLNRWGGTGTGYLSLEGGVFRDVHADRISRLSQVEENRPITSNSF